MGKIDRLIERARKLKEKGLTTGEIAEELNVSRETALWLITKGKAERPPSDVHIDIRALSSSPERLRNIAKILAGMIKGKPDVVIGIATSGIPIATMVSEEIGCELAVYFPKKLKWDGTDSHVGGTFSENFADVTGKTCVIVDDIISTGRTILEVAESVRKKEGKILAATVIVDKRAQDEIDGIPILSILRITRI